MCFFPLRFIKVSCLTNCSNKVSVCFLLHSYATRHSLSDTIRCVCFRFHSSKTKFQCPACLLFVLQLCVRFFECFTLCSNPVSRFNLNLFRVHETLISSLQTQLISQCASLLLQNSAMLRSNLSPWKCICFEDLTTLYKMMTPIVCGFQCYRPNSSSYNTFTLLNEVTRITDRRLTDMELTG